MNLQKLKYIIEIADSHSITKASKKLFVSQPYLSKVVSELETQLNTKIFIRNNNGLELTDEGHRVYLLAQSIINQVELLENLGSNHPLKDKNIQLSFSIANLILKDSLLLNYLNITHSSRSDIDFYETTISGCINNVEKNISDFAIVVVDDYQKPLFLSMIQHKDIEYHELEDGYFYFHLHRDHPLANDQKIKIDNLVHYPYVMLKNDEFTAFTEDKFKNEYPQSKLIKSFVVNNYHLYLSIVKNNGAFMIGNKWQISELEKMGVKSIRFSSLKHKVHLGIIKKRMMTFNEETEQFIQLFKESYGLNNI